MQTSVKRGLATLAIPVMTFGLVAATCSPALAKGPYMQPAETTACSNSLTPCTNVSSLQLNQGNAPSYIMNVTGAGSLAGRKINLSRASNSSSTEDFVIGKAGTLGQLCGVPGANRLDPTSYACVHYPSGFPVYQGQYSPLGNGSGYCVGAAATAQGQQAVLESCGGTRTLFVADLAASITITLPGPFQPLIYFPLEAAADTNLSNPLVLTLRPSSSNPANALYLQPENFSSGSVTDKQMFTLTAG